MGAQLKGEGAGFRGAGEDAMATWVRRGLGMFESRGIGGRRCMRNSAELGR